MARKKRRTVRPEQQAEVRPPQDKPGISMMWSLVRFLEATAGLAALAYAFGFMVVNFHYLARYGTPAMGLLSARYVATGVLFLAPLAYVFTTAGLLLRSDKPFQQRFDSEIRRGFTEIRAWWKILQELINRKTATWATLHTVIIGGLIIFLDTFPAKGVSPGGLSAFNREWILGWLTWLPGVFVWAWITFALSLWIQGIWRVQESRPSVPELKVIVNFLILANLIASGAYFSGNVYPQVSQALGGGKPIPVIVRLRDPVPNSLIPLVQGPSYLLADTNGTYLLLAGSPQANRVFRVDKAIVNSVEFLPPRY